MIYLYILTRIYLLIFIFFTFRYALVSQEIKIEFNGDENSQIRYRYLIFLYFKITFSDKT